MEDILLRMQNEFLHEMVLSVPEDENEFDDDHAAIQDNNELKSKLDEIKTLNRELEELNSILAELSINNTKSKHKLENEKEELVQILRMREATQNELANLEKSYEEITQFYKLKAERQHHNLFHSTHETRTSMLHNDYKIMSRLEREQSKIISWQEKNTMNESLHDLSFKRFSTLEILMGIKLIENAVLGSSIDESLSKSSTICLADKRAAANQTLLEYYNIMFLYLIDDVLFNNDCENSAIKSIKSKLSNETMARYQTMFKKRSFSRSANKPNCLFLNNMGDFQVVYENYMGLVCYLLTKQEVEDARNKFPIDHIDGSPVIIIILSQTSANKRATIVLPKFYPFSGTSGIRLITMSGHSNTKLKPYQIEHNLNSVSEWIRIFIDMYNRDELR